MKTLIFCTKAKPFLCNVKNELCFASVSHPDFMLVSEYASKEAPKDALNGLVCFECECKEAFNIKETSAGEYHSFLNRAQLTEKQFWEYLGSKKAYALHFEHIKPLDPFPVTELYSDQACTKPLKRAPRSWGYAYRLVDFGCFYRAQKVLVFSIKSTWTNAPTMKDFGKNIEKESCVNEKEQPIDYAHKNMASKMALEILMLYGEPKIENGDYVLSTKNAYLRLSTEDVYFTKGCARDGTPCGCALDFWDSKEKRGQGAIYTYKDFSEGRIRKMLCGLIESLGFKKADWEQLSLF